MLLVILLEGASKEVVTPSSHYLSLFLFEFDFPWILVLWDNVPWAKLLEVLRLGV